VRRLALLLLLLLGAVVASGAGRYLWVQVDPETGERRLSDGRPLPPELGRAVVPGQYLEAEGGRLKPKRQWRPPLDLERDFQPADAPRVVFSHERHFAALGAKGETCETCHNVLDEQKTWASLAPAPGVEPHGESSLGRFCSTCHDGETRASEVEGASPPRDGPIFTAFGRQGDPDCARCHVPRDHGRDFTPWHGEAAEEGGRYRCADCHRGARTITRAEAEQALRFYHAQMRLLENPEDESAFSVTLPNNFCAYCHGLDLEAWYED